MGRLGLTLLLALSAIYTVGLSLDLLVFWTDLYAGVPAIVSVVFALVGFTVIAGLVQAVYRARREGGYRVPVKRI